MPRNPRSLLVSILALWHGRSQKQIGAAAGIPQKRVSQLLRGEGIEDEALERLLAAVDARPAEVSIVTGCLESLAFLERDQELTAEERVEVEQGVQELAGINRRALTEAARRSRTALVLDRYPEPADLEPARWHASMLLGLLRSLPQDQQWALVSVGEEYRSWALVESLCEESVVQASRDLGRAASLARLARKAARRVRGPREWVRRVRAFAAAHAANVLRVSGRLKAAGALLQKAGRLWEAGSDPSFILDPGRLLDLEASLRRDQRRFEESLALLEKARKVSRSPAHTLINKGFTLEVMGDYERAIEALREAESMPDVRANPRLLNILQNNLTLNLCHTGRFSEAAALAQKVREAAVEMSGSSSFWKKRWLRSSKPL
jgi:tetratricopeptide (TPR) repeat protein